MSELPEKSQLLVKFGGVPRIMDRMVTGFLDSNTGHLDGLKNAIKAKDSNLLAAKAHSYKGSLGYFCQGSLYELVRKIEELASQHELDEATKFYPEVEEKSLLLASHLAAMVGSS